MLKVRYRFWSQYLTQSGVNINTYRTSTSLNASNGLTGFIVCYVRRNQVKDFITSQMFQNHSVPARSCIGICRATEYESLVLGCQQH